MRMLTAFLIVIAAIYFWDVEYNNGTLWMERAAWGGLSRTAPGGSEPS